MLKAAQVPRFETEWLQEPMRGFCSLRFNQATQIEHSYCKESCDLFPFPWRFLLLGFFMAF